MKFLTQKKSAIRIVSALLIFSIIFPQLPVKNAEAQVLGTGITPTHQISNSDPGTILFYSNSAAFYSQSAAKDTIKTNITTKTWWEKVYEKGQEIAFEILRQAILDKLVSNLIKWIEGGGRGAIVDDWGAFFQDSANRAGGIFASQIGNGFLCGPFNLQVQLALIPVQQFDNITCTLNDVVRNIDSFMEDFRNGSWIGYQTTWEPRNNFYGATLIAMDEQSKAIQRATDAAAAEAAAGRGFLSFKKCEIVKDKNGTLNSLGNPWRPLAPEAGLGVEEKYSKQCRITTPGEVAGAAITKALVDAPFDKANSATSKLLTSYLAAIINASINTLTKAAVEGLRGAVAEATKDTNINPVLPCAGLTGEGFRSCLASVNAERASYQFTQDSNSAIYASSNAIDTRFQLAGIYSQSIFNEKNLVDALADLAACKNNPADVVRQLADEQESLDLLQQKFDDNQLVIDQVQGQQNGESTDTAGQNISTTQADWSSLTSLSSGGETDLRALIDELNASKDELDIIKARVASQLPGLELQLQSCPRLTPAAPPSNL